MMQKDLSRRVLLGGGAALGVLRTVPAKASIPRHGGRAAPPSAQLATHTLVNTSGSTITSSASASLITPRFGHVFKKGDIPAGTAPSFTTGSGTVIHDFVWGNQTYWSDGSLKYANFRLRLKAGTSIAGNGSLAVAVNSGGTAPSGSGFTNSDFNAQAVVVSTTGAGSGFGLSGAWGAWLDTVNNASNIATSKTTVTLDGPVGQGRSFWIEMSQTNGGAAHGTLVCQIDMDILRNEDGSRAFHEVLFDVCQPYYADSQHAAGDAAGVKNWRAFSAYGWSNNGGSTTAVPFPFSNQTCTANGSTTLTTAVAHGFWQGTGDFSTIPVRVTSAGSSGLSTSQLYFAASFGAQPNSLTLSTRSDGTYLFALSVPSSTFTIQPLYAVMPFCHLFGADINGKYNFFQGTGNVASRPTIRTQYDKTYWRSTKLIDAWDPSFTPSFVATSGAGGNSVSWPNWNPCYLGPLEADFATTGERPTLGLFTSWAATHFYNQSAIDEYILRAFGMSAGCFVQALYDATTKTIPNLRNQAYTGMPAATSTLSFEYGPTAIGFTAPPWPEVGHQGLTLSGAGGDWAHRPSSLYYTYLVFGEPHVERQLREWASGFNFFGGSADRNTTNMPVVVYGIPAWGDAYRTMSWAAREVANAAAMCPPTVPESIYLNDLASDTFRYYKSWLGTAPLNNAYHTTNGMWAPICPETGATDQILEGGSWLINYFASTLVHASNVLENADATAIVVYIKTWANNKFNNCAPNGSTGGGFFFCSYQDKIWESSFAGGANGLPPITSNDHYGIVGWGGNVSWTAGTPGVFTITRAGSGNPGPAKLNLQNGDRIFFDSFQAFPTGAIVTGAPMYVRNVSGTPDTGPFTCNMSTTPTGALFNTTNSGTADPAASLSWPAAGSGFGSIQNYEYGAESLGWMNRAKRAGIVTTDLDALISDLTTRVVTDNGFVYDTLNTIKYKMAA